MTCYRPQTPCAWWARSWILGGVVGLEEATKAPGRAPDAARAAAPLPGPDEPLRGAHPLDPPLRPAPVPAWHPRRGHAQQPRLLPGRGLHRPARPVSGVRAGATDPRPRRDLPGVGDRPRRDL